MSPHDDHLIGELAAGNLRHHIARRGVGKHFGAHLQPHHQGLAPVSHALHQHGVLNRHGRRRNFGPIVRVRAHGPGVRRVEGVRRYRPDQHRHSAVFGPLDGSPPAILDRLAIAGKRNVVEDNLAGRCSGTVAELIEAAHHQNFRLDAPKRRAHRAPETEHGQPLPAWR